MACFDITIRALPSGRGGRITLWLVTPTRPPLVLNPYPEQGVTKYGSPSGWWALAEVDDRYWYYKGRRASFMP